MTYTLKGYVVIATFLILAIDFGNQEKFVSGKVAVVKLAEHADVHPEKITKADGADGAEDPDSGDESDESDKRDEADKSDDSTVKSASHQRRNAHQPQEVEKAVVAVADPDVIVPHIDKVEIVEKPGSPIIADKPHEIPVHPLDENGKYVGPFDPDCSDTIIITPMKKEVDLEFEHKLLKPGGTTCHWTVIGTEDCVPVVTCRKFHLVEGNNEKEDPCADEFLEITDGSFGFQRFCGKEGPDDVTSGRKYRDFYITLKLSAQKTNRAFECTVTCSPGKVHGKPLDENTEPELDESCNCGRKPIMEHIVGSEDSRRGEFPWMAAMVAAGTRKPFCGATIINNRMILTAAHCFKGAYMKASNINILINAHKLNFSDSNEAGGAHGGSKALWTAEQLLEKDKKDQSYRFTVDKYFIHPLYVRATSDFDVALIKLDKPIDFKLISGVVPACIPQPNHYGESKENANAVVTGWGVDHNAATSTQHVLQKLDISVFTDDECKEFYGGRYTRRMLCAGYRDGGRDSCKGDPGSPLISEKSKNTWEQIGISSFGEHCVEKHQPGVYINTRQVSQWIRYISNMEAAIWCNGN